jgi:hypothetical protein
MPNLKSGMPWSEIDDRDIRWCIRHGLTVAEIADFLCREPAEVEHRIETLELPMPDSKNVVSLKRK